MVARDRVFAYEYRGYWQDIGTVEAYYQSNMDLLSAKPRLALDGPWPAIGDNTENGPYVVGENGSVENSVIGPGCVIEGHVENSILSPGVHVDRRAEVRDSIVMSNVHIGYHSVVNRCILDEAVRVAKFCYVGFGLDHPGSNGEITLLGRQVEVPPNTAIGRKCRIMPRVGPTAFVGRFVPSGSTVYRLEATSGS